MAFRYISSEGDHATEHARQGSLFGETIDNPFYTVSSTPDGRFFAHVGGGYERGPFRTIDEANEAGKYLADLAQKHWDRDHPVPKWRERNPLLAIVGNPKRHRRSRNPSVPSSASIQKLPGFKKAYKRFVHLHGVKPTGVQIIRVDDGKSKITKKVVFTVGDIPEFVYQGTIGGVKIKGSNKAGKTWVHKTARKNMPMLAVDPDTDQLFALGGETKVTDWLREKSERPRKH